MTMASQLIFLIVYQGRKNQVDVYKYDRGMKRSYMGQLLQCDDSIIQRLIMVEINSEDLPSGCYMAQIQFYWGYHVRKIRTADEFDSSIR